MSQVPVCRESTLGQAIEAVQGSLPHREWTKHLVALGMGRPNPEAPPNSPAISAYSKDEQEHQEPFPDGTGKRTFIWSCAGERGLLMSHGGALGFPQDWGRMGRGTSWVRARA